MKRKLAIFLILICSLFSFAACSSNSEPDFQVLRQSASWEIATGHSFEFSVDVVMNKKFKYRGSSSYANLVQVTIYTEIGGVTYTLKSEPVPISANSVRMKLKKGQKFECKRQFQATVWDEGLEEYVPAPVGNYFLRVSYFGKVVECGYWGRIISATVM